MIVFHGFHFCFSFAFFHASTVPPPIIVVIDLHTINNNNYCSIFSHPSEERADQRQEEEAQSIKHRNELKIATEWWRNRSCMRHCIQTNHPKPKMRWPTNLMLKMYINVKNHLVLIFLQPIFPSFSKHLSFPQLPVRWKRWPFHIGDIIDFSSRVVPTWLGKIFFRKAQNWAQQWQKRQGTVRRYHRHFENKKAWTAAWSFRFAVKVVRSKLNFLLFTWVCHHLSQF